MEEIRKLVDTLSPRTAHQYRSYCKRYVEWLVQRGIIEQELREETFDAVQYARLPISTQLVHWHLIDTMGTGSLPSIRKCISSLKFLEKLCLIHRGSDVPAHGAATVTKLDEKYLENVTRVREVREQEEEQGPLAQNLHIVSANVWNPHSQLPEKYFRNCFEQLRFLVDFQWRLYTKMSYTERSRVRIAELVGHEDGGGISLELETWSQLGEYVNGAEPQLRSRQTVVVVPHANPLVCPLVSLAAYFFLRFHDGGGFPELRDKNGSWREMPIVRGKSPGDYPREETLGNYYAAVFRYCRLNYKRREWFGQNKLQYPTWKPDEYEFFERHQPELQEAFPMNVPRDFLECFNLGVGYGAVDVGLAGGRRDLLVQLFPELESYKRHGGLDQDAQRFVKLLEVLRVHLLRALPVLYRLFPDHDLFKTDTLSRPDFKAFYVDVEANDYGMAELVLGQGPQEKERDSVPIPASASSSDVFQLVQFQTVSNFEILLKLLSQIFDRLEMKKSSREFAIHQLSLVHDTLRDRIKSSKPGDEKAWGQGEEDEEEANGEEEELKNMVEQLVSAQIRTQVSALEGRLERLVDEKIDSRLEKLLGKRFAEEDGGVAKKLKPELELYAEEPPVFKLDPDIDSVEAVILEWFTPNPTMGNECVHSMNKKDKSWRNGFESLYKERKTIVEFYIYLVNHRGMDRYKAVDLCERIRGGGDLTDFAQVVRDWKREHETFDGLGDL
ncbi:hypothetical protein ZYGR_0BB00640 [Zygosaccharomyces rouxii]|uniref:Uncharacterized protein n=1 Tax=Zygosaccharomyces rouxii TaxID=4956 RepID=A0A1Q3AKK8_ZYGRO|nr:hypothetical protein ZYGR_0BB00640 [Zygosaccharomyces rouxii]